MKNSLKYTYKNQIIYVALIMLAILISLHSSISPINSNGYITTDVSVWTNIAKRMCQGEIMYKDFFDHKGPILYFLYYIGYLFKGCLGIWIIELICNVINVIYIYKISKLILKDNVKSLIIVAICMCFLSGLCVIENPCTESLSLPFILISLYMFIEYILDINKFSCKKSFYSGICFAIVLLLRPNIATVWVVYYIYIFIKLIRLKQIKCLINIILFSFMGVIIVFIPIVIYLLKNEAFLDFVKTYLLFNIKYANNKENNIIEVISYFIIYTNNIIGIVGTIYIIFLGMKTKININQYKLLKVNFIYFIVTFYMAIMPQRIYMHYLIPMMPTLIVALAICLDYIKTSKEVDKIITVSVLFVCSVISVYYIKEISYEKSNYISYIKEISNKVQELTKEEDNVLVLGNKTIIYLISNRNYTGKYLYQMPIANQNEEISKEIIEDIKYDLPELIVNTMPDWDTDSMSLFEQKIKNILEQNYFTEDKIIYIKK